MTMTDPPCLEYFCGDFVEFGCCGEGGRMKLYTLCMRGEWIISGGYREWEYEGKVQMTEVFVLLGYLRRY